MYAHECGHLIMLLRGVLLKLIKSSYKWLFKPVDFPLTFGLCRLAFGATAVSCHPQPPVLPSLPPPSPPHLFYRWLTVCSTAGVAHMLFCVFAFWPILMQNEFRVQMKFISSNWYLIQWWLFTLPLLLINFIPIKWWKIKTTSPRLTPTDFFPPV